MTGKDIPKEVRYAVDIVLRKRIIHQTYFEPERYAKLLDEITTEVMAVIWTAD